MKKFALEVTVHRNGTDVELDSVAPEAVALLSITGCKPEEFYQLPNNKTMLFHFVLEVLAPAGIVISILMCSDFCSRTNTTQLRGILIKA